MKPMDMAAEIRTAAFVDEHGVEPDRLAEAAEIIARTFRRKLEAVIAGQPWWVRLLFRRGYEYAVEVLEKLVGGIREDQKR